MSKLISMATTFSIPQLISLATGAFAFFFVILIAVIRDDRRYKYERKAHDEENDWLFTNWDTKLYDAITKKTPDEMLSKLGVKTEQYLKDCAVIHNHFPDMKRLAADKVIGLIIMVFGLALFAMFGTGGIIIDIIVFIAGFELYQGDVKKVHKEAEAKRHTIEAELPRFLDLLQTALFINMPIEEAIIVTAKSMRGTTVADELLATMAESQFGVVSWQDALYDIAQKYEVDNLSDFVQYIIIGYEKGLSIYDVVSRQAREVRDNAKSNARETANRVNTSIIVPITVFKLFPIIAMIGYPIIIQFLTNGII